MNLRNYFLSIMRVEETCEKIVVDTFSLAVPHE